MKTKTETQMEVTGESLISQSRFRSAEAEGRYLVYCKEVEAFAAEK